jgi:hypothetical protein
MVFSRWDYAANTGRCSCEARGTFTTTNWRHNARHRAHIVIARQIVADFVAVVQLAPQHRAQLRGIWHALPHQADGLFGHAQNNGAALRIGHGGIGLPKTAGHATARRFEFGVDALCAGLQGGEKVKLAHGVSWLIA